MPVVLVLGANGYIGQAVASAFRRAGHRVYGVVRSQEKGTQLSALEILPVVGDTFSPDTYNDYIQKAAVIVDASGPADWNDPKTGHLKIFNAVKAASSPTNKKIYIYTSGILVHGPSSHLVDETSQLNTTPPFQWRVELEREVLSHKEVRSIVIRPGYVYGGNGGNYGLGNYFQVKDKIVFQGRPDKKTSWVHVEDLADAYVRAVRNIAASEGERFNIGIPTGDTTLDVARRAAQLLTGRDDLPVENHPAQGFSAISDFDVRVNPQKAYEVLGWKPAHSGPVEELDIYYETWKATRTAK